MNRLRRIINAGMVATSILLCAALITLWVRSLTTLDEIGYSWPTTAEGRYSRIDWSAYSQDGNVLFARTQHISTTSDGEQMLLMQDVDSSWKLGWVVKDRYDASWKEFASGLGRFTANTDVESSGDLKEPHYYLSFPLWLPLLLASLPADIAALRILRHRRARRRAARNHCPTCNYDLRESPGRCPECGREASVVSQP